MSLWLIRGLFGFRAFRVYGWPVVYPYSGRYGNMVDPNLTRDERDPAYSQIKNSILQLADNPRPHGYKKLKGRDGYRIRVGDYRVLYNIFDNILSVDVVNLGHRKDIYE
ncbi:MAG: type II toxin-antitoxin system RelE/ParE family toxin [Chitinophagaceae bacterium]|nr:type II toxin-antitoxin system RelE/ParE family toxin [Chitinophagaceae bacterium]